jgi:hypothetical protein
MRCWIKWVTCRPCHLEQANVVSASKDLRCYDESWNGVDNTIIRMVGNYLYALIVIPSLDFRSFDSLIARSRWHGGGADIFFITYNKRTPRHSPRSFHALALLVWYFVRPDLSARSTAKAGGRDDKGGLNYFYIVVNGHRLERGGG